MVEIACWLRRACLVGLGALVGCGAHHAHLMPAGAAPSEEAAMTLLSARCTSCHDLDRILTSVGTAEQWQAVVHRMVYHHKAKLLTHVTDDEAEIIARWLSETQRPERGGISIGFIPSGRPL